jgi:hypothetical protein
VRIDKVYSHLNGYEWLEIQRPGFWKEIREAIDLVDAGKCLNKVSKEKRKLGKVVYSPSNLNKRFKSVLVKKGWKESRVDYWVTDDDQLIRETLEMDADEQKEWIEDEGKAPIRSYNATDFVKNRVAIEVQFGKYSFISYDLFVKHLAFYVGDEIDCGVEILPMKSMQSCMSSGPGYYEKALYDLVRQGRGVPAVPLILIGVVP